MGNSIYEMIGYIIIAGFVGAILLGILIRLFEYFIIGIIFLIIGVSLYNLIFSNYCRDNWSFVNSIIFSGVTISFPYIPHIFTFMMLNLEFGLIVVLTAISSYYLLKVSDFKQDWRYFLMGIVCLVISLGIYEISLLLFAFVISSSFLLELSKNNLQRREVLLIIKKILFFILSLVISCVLYKIIGISLRYFFNIADNSYIDMYIDLILNRSFINVNIYRENLIIFSLLLIFSVCMLARAYKNRNIFLFIYLLLYLIIVFIIFNISIVVLPKRISVFIGFFLGFMCSVIYLELMKMKNPILKKVFLICMVLLIFINSKDMNQLFYKDYIRYNQDVLYANNIYYDIVKNSIKDESRIKVFFKGNPSYYSRNTDDVIGVSIFSHDRDIKDYEEKNGMRIYNFMKMLGYDVIRPDSTRIEEYWNDTINMNAYPYKNSIKYKDGTIIVKLGESIYDSFKIKKNEFLDKFNVNNVNIKLTDELFSIDDSENFYFNSKIQLNFDNINSIRKAFIVFSKDDEQNLFLVSPYSIIEEKTNVYNISVGLNVSGLNEVNVYEKFNMFLLLYINDTPYIIEIPKKSL